ncbi:hypothetical protein NDU88_001301 [Pleurodeles waltl]|uniref:Uncharacterized protein n=1 Tax=Pleurodeles waltl TaxID=8319 RepID=A0AAV7LYC3_PLEWA|nr:hypothetical protein NDU88_001301 [Pleurodeles waltl]
MGVHTGKTIGTKIVALSALIQWRCSQARRACTAPCAAVHNPLSMARPICCSSQAHDDNGGPLWAAATAGPAEMDGAEGGLMRTEEWLQSPEQEKLVSGATGGGAIQKTTTEGGVCDAFATEATHPLCL